MPSVMSTKIFVSNEKEMIALGRLIGEKLKGGEVLQLVSDLGGGKTTFTKGVALGMGIEEEVTSPSFAVSKVYETKELTLHHYDFYRLDEIGLMADELVEVLDDEQSVCVIEWARDAASILPSERLISVEINRKATGENDREVVMTAPDELGNLMEDIT